MLLDLLSGPVVELVDVKDRQITFRSKRPLSPGKSISLRLATGNGRAVSARVSVSASRPLCQGFACSGYLAEEVQLPEFDNQRLAGVDPYLRRAPRTDCRLRVLSPDLPGFRALTLDFSTTGLQVEGEGRVEVGREVRLILEFDCGLPSLDCSARVAWCSDRGGRTALGLQFVHLSQEARVRLESFERFLLSREETPILQRLLAAPPAPVQEAPPACGRVLSYAVEGAQVSVAFRPSQGPVLNMRFADYQGLNDNGRVVGKEIARLREVPADKGVRYQFLNAADEVILEVRARDCQVGS